ncbi:DUF202 domain-containing protein [Leucobacter allii]|uniref:DUF202 domain-containing protein n=1 Tax=Leucobacter allii TaxID=2932247 RepID=UPI001FD42280|nr:DUF202 domain-containing protein [Leucobacter allii]UOR00490.1 DUF202 domain-containing protein [Leucobacter allii]
MTGAARDGEAAIPRDPGLQPERTALAWRRTGLALAVGALASMRLLPAVLGPWSVLFGAAGVGVGLGIAILEHRRFARPAAGHGLPRADGLPVALLCAAAVAAGLLCLVLVLGLGSGSGSGAGLDSGAMIF